MPRYRGRVFWSQGEFTEAYFPEPHVEFSIVLDWIKFVTVTCSKTYIQIEPKRPTGRDLAEAWESAPAKSSFWYAVNLAKRR